MQDSLDRNYKSAWKNIYQFRNLKSPIISLFAAAKLRSVKYLILLFNGTFFCNFGQLQIHRTWFYLEKDKNSNS